MYWGTYYIKAMKGGMYVRHSGPVTTYSAVQYSSWWREDDDGGKAKDPIPLFPLHSRTASGQHQDSIRTAMGFQKINSKLAELPRHCL